MIRSFKPSRQVLEDVGAAVLALAYVGGFILAVDHALARLVFHSAF